MEHPVSFNFGRFTSSRTRPKQYHVVFAFVFCVGMLLPLTSEAIQRKQLHEQLSQFDQDAAWEYLVEICDIGPRPSTSKGMRKQQKYLKTHFEALGAKVISQPFVAKNPETGGKARLHNIVIQFHPDRKKRLLICCHHDTRPFADADPQRPRGAFIGANDGGSGVALLCELGKHMKSLDGIYGIDFAFFDGEEFVIQRKRDPMFLGSTHFANLYDQGKLGCKYEYAILVDMVADKDLQIYFEGNSLVYADKLTRSIWSVAHQLEIDEFFSKEEHKIRDDHLPLNDIARIPTCDIIDFDFPNPQQGNIYWHTQKDTLENCSADSLGKVGSVVLEWIRQMQDLHKGD